MVNGPDKIYASIVAAGYLSSIEDFKGLIKYGLKEYKFEEKELPIVLSGDMKPDSHLLTNLKMQLPIVNFNDIEDKFLLTFVRPEAKVIIEDKKFSILESAKLKEISKSIIFENSQNLAAIGVNFIAEINYPKKLRLLNNGIKKIKTWDDNDGFQLIIPIKIENRNVVATYKIQKINEEICDGSEDNKNRIYSVEVNFNYNLSDNIQEKETQLNDIFNIKFEEYYNEFIDNFKIILNVGSENV